MVDKDKFVPMQVNDTVAVENLAGMWNLYKELLEYCLEMEEQRKAELEKSFTAGDIRGYEIQIHALKGAMRTLGIEELADLAYEQELACKEGRWNDVVADYVRFMGEYERGHRTVEAYLEQWEH